MKQFKLKRQLMYGMQGEDVKLMQQLLNISNLTNNFYEGKIPENGNFDMFRTRVCLSKFQEWCDMNKTYCYDAQTHSMLILSANLALGTRNTPTYLMYTK